MQIGIRFTVGKDCLEGNDTPLKEKLQEGWKVIHLVRCGENKKFGLMYAILEKED